jgi:hypothetical protein
MTDRQSILAQLNLLDTPTLSKLLNLSQTLIVPDQESLISVGFEDMVTHAHELADVYFPQWTDRSKADFGEFLIEIMSLQSWKDFTYMNIYHREAFERRAQTYVYVALHAIRNGYQPGQHSSSETHVSLTFAGVPAPVTYPVGAVEVTYANTNLVFTNAEEINVAAGDSVVNVLFKSGKVATDSGRFNGKSIRVSGRYIDPSSITLQVLNDVWLRVNSFANYDENAKVFMVLPSDGEDVELTFGMGGYGQRPATNSAYAITYRVDAVNDKNVAVGQLSITKGVVGGYLSNAVMTDAAVKGRQAEDIESIREHASMMYRVNGRRSVTNPKSAITLLETHPDVYKATAFNFANDLFFAVIPKSGMVADIPFLDTVAADLDLVNVVAQPFELHPSLTNYVTITGLELTAYIYNEYNVADVENQIRDYIEFITNPLEGAQYGVGLDIGALSLNIKEKIGGVSNLVVDTVNGGPALNVPLSGLQIFHVINQADLIINVIKVS